MKKIFVLAVSLSLSLALAAADFDLIIKTNSEKIEALIQEVSDTEVRYKKATNPNGPTFVLSITEIATIIYANGEVQAIASSQTTSTATRTTTGTATKTTTSTLSNGGQFDHIFASYQQQKKVKQERPKRTYEWEHFLLANYACAFTPYQYNQHAFGLTYGHVKLFGWYVNALLGTGFNYAYTGVGPYFYNNYSLTYPFYTGKISHNLVSATVGGVARLVIPLYVYTGIGYTYHSTTAEIVGGDWVLLDPYQYDDVNGHLLNFDIGLQGQYKGFTLSLGYMAIINVTEEHSLLHTLKLGIGYTFKTKK